MYGRCLIARLDHKARNIVADGMNMEQVDCIVAGAGVIGLAIAGGQGPPGPHTRQNENPGPHRTPAT